MLILKVVLVTYLGIVKYPKKILHLSCSKIIGPIVWADIMPLELPGNNCDIPVYHNLYTTMLSQYQQLMTSHYILISFILWIAIILSLVIFIYFLYCTAAYYGCSKAHIQVKTSLPIIVYWWALRHIPCSYISGMETTPPLWLFLSHCNSNDNRFFSFNIFRGYWPEREVGNWWIK